MPHCPLVVNKISPNLPLEPHRCRGQWFCTECLECRSTADPCECPVSERIHLKIVKFKLLHWIFKRCWCFDGHINISGDKEKPPCTWFPTDTYSTQWERECLQDVQHGLQHAATPQQMGKPGREEPTGSRVRRHQPSVATGPSRWWWILTSQPSPRDICQPLCGSSCACD